MPLPGIPTPASGISASAQGPHDVSRFNLSIGRCALPGLVAGAHMTQRSRCRDCQAQEDRGADATDDIEAGGERRTGRVEQVRAQRAGQVLSRGHGGRDAFTGGIDRLVGDAGRHRAGQLVSVDDSAQAAEGGYAERDSELAAGLPYRCC